MRVRFLIAALQELEEAAGHYDALWPGLGSKLYEEIEAALTFISDFPGASPKTKRGAHRYNLKRFPYYLIYQARDGDIVIGAVAHGRRKPFYWRKRNFKEP